MVNKELAKRQGLSQQEVDKINKLHKKRDKIEKSMKQTDKENTHKLLELFKKWTDNEFAMQRLWKFEENRDWHMSYGIPHCVCPVLDNMDLLGTSMKYNNPNCIYHGTKWSNDRLNITGLY